MRTPLVCAYHFPILTTALPAADRVSRRASYRARGTSNDLRLLDARTARLWALHDDRLRGDNLRLRDHSQPRKYVIPSVCWYFREAPLINRHKASRQSSGSQSSRYFAWCPQQKRPAKSFRSTHLVSFALGILNSVAVPNAVRGETRRNNALPRNQQNADDNGPYANDNSGMSGNKQNTREKRLGEFKLS